MWSKLRRGKPLKSAMIRIAIDPQPYPHDTNERQETYGGPLTNIVHQYFAQSVCQYYYNSNTKLLTNIEIGCFNGKNVKNHDEYRHNAIVDILHNIQTFFMYKNIKCTIIHVLDTDMSFMDYTVMFAQKKIYEINMHDTNDEQAPIRCEENGVFVVCPECNKSTELVMRASYPHDSEIDEAIRLDDDLA